MRFAQSCILGRLRKKTFFSLTEANAAIDEMLARIREFLIDAQCDPEMIDRVMADEMKRVL